MKKKKIIAFVTAIVLIICSFTSGMFSAFAKTQKLILGTEIINTTDGNDDKLWYYFTPEQTGMYTFLSFNRIRFGEAYLFEKENKEYTQLAYSNSSPNWEYYNQPNADQFCISYQLEAGKTYYYAAGWDSSRTSGELTVKLIYEGSEQDVIDRLEVNCNAELTWYTDGSWKTDSAGESYFFYNYSKILQNMTVNVYYKNGSMSSVSAGGSNVDGYSIKYNQTQAENHWYPKEDEKYTGNIITVSILNKSTQYDVTINQNALFTVSGAVCDYVSNEPLSGATVSINGLDITTDEKGQFSFVSAPGFYSGKISGNNIITRSFNITVDVNNDNNNHTDEPIGVVVGDYVSDGVINAKDYAYILKNFTDAKQETEASKFSSQINFTADNYPGLIL